MTSSHKTRKRSRLGQKKQVRPGVWQIRVSVGYKADGTPRRVRETVYGTELDADARIFALRAEMGSDPVRGSKYTLDEYFKSRFLPSRSDLTKANNDTHTYMWAHVPQRWKDAEIHEPSHDDVQEWLLSMPRGTSRAAMRTFRAVLRQAWMNGLLTKEPLKYQFRYPRKYRSKIHVWDEKQIAEALQRMRGDRLEAFLICMAALGLRREEGLALDWENISFEPYEKDDEGNVLHWWAHVQVFEAVTSLDGEKGTKNDDSYRIVPMAPVFADRLHEIRRDSGPVATNRYGARISVGGLRKRWDTLFEEGHTLPSGKRRPDYPLHGMERITPNRLRHSNETLMHDLGVSDTTITQFHGHSAGSTDARHYIARTKRAFNAAAELVGNAVGEAMEGDDGC